MRRGISEHLAQFACDVGTDGPVAVAGRRTRWDHGGRLRSDARVVSAPAGIVEYRPEEMTVRVGCGSTVADLHRVLAEHGQRTALPDRGGTVGGAVAVGENDVHVLRRGRVRDAVLELSYVSADGRTITAGGPTVKNVSGYDLPRLMVGSLGTLGLFGEVVLRTCPTGEVEQWLGAVAGDPFEVFAALYRPSAVLWDGEHSWVHLEGHAADVEHQIAVVRTLGDYQAVDGPPVLPPHRWSFRPSALPYVTQLIDGRFVASIGAGVVWADRPRVDPRTASSPVDGIARRVKSAFDPSGRLNPGRLAEWSP